MRIREGSGSGLRFRPSGIFRSNTVQADARVRVSGVGLPCPILEFMASDIRAVKAIVLMEGFRILGILSKQNMTHWPGPPRCTGTLAGRAWVKGWLRAVGTVHAHSHVIAHSLRSPV